VKGSKIIQSFDDLPEHIRKDMTDREAAEIKGMIESGARITLEKRQETVIQTKPLREALAKKNTKRNFWFLRDLCGRTVGGLFGASPDVVVAM
jgi:hypothetical protein